jgi:hypothetical protein
MTSRLALRLARAIVRRYPAAWRERYEAELLALIEDAPPRWRDVVDLGRGSLVERAGAVVEPAAHPTLSAAVVLAARYVLVPATMVAGAVALGMALKAALGPPSVATADTAGVVCLLLIAGSVLAYLARGIRSVLAGVPRWSLGLPHTLIWLGILVGLIALETWTGETPTTFGVLRWLYQAAIGTFLVLSHSPVRPGQRLVDSVNQLMLAREQLSWARMELTRCQTLASEGAAVEGELARAQSELARWQTQHDEAMRALQSMGYRARLP